MHRLFEFDTDNILPHFNGYYDTVLYKLRPVRNRTGLNFIVFSLFTNLVNA